MSASVIIQLISFALIVASIISFRKPVKPHHVKSKEGLFYPFAFILTAFILFFIGYLIEKYFMNSF